MEIATRPIMFHKPTSRYQSGQLPRSPFPDCFPVADDWSGTAGPTNLTNKANGHSLVRAGLETKGHETVPRYPSISFGSTSAF